MGRIVFFCAVLWIASPLCASAEPLSVHDSFNLDSQERWKSMSEKDQHDSIVNLIGLSGGKVPESEADDIQYCAAEKVKNDFYQGYDFATVYTACIKQMNLN